MGIDSIIQNAPAAALLLLPGFVWRQFEARFVPRSQLSVTRELYQYVLYSFVAIACTLWITKPNVPEDLLASFQTVGVGIGVGAVGGTLTGICGRYDWIGTLFRKAHLPALHPIATAWDRAWSSGPCVVQVRLASGETIFGVFGLRALASTESDDRDLFLDQVLVPNTLGQLEPQIASKGVWLSCREVISVHLFELGELDNDIARELCATPQ